MKIYDIIFYYIYRSLRKSFFQGSPEFVSALILGNLLFFNLLSLISIVEIVLNDFQIDLEKQQLIFIYLLMLFVNLIYFYKGNKYQKIVDRYREDKKEVHKKRGFLVFMFSLLSIIIMFLTISLK